MQLQRSDVGDLERGLTRTSSDGNDKERRTMDSGLDRSLSAALPSSIFGYDCEGAYISLVCLPRRLPVETVQPWLITIGLVWGNILCSGTWKVGSWITMSID